MRHNHVGTYQLSHIVIQNPTMKLFICNHRQTCQYIYALFQFIAIICMIIYHRCMEHKYFNYYMMRKYRTKIFMMQLSYTNIINMYHHDMYHDTNLWYIFCDTIQWYIFKFKKNRYSLYIFFTHFKSRFLCHTAIWMYFA